MNNKIFYYFFLLFTGISLYANNLLDQYRTNGIEHIEKTMDLELTKTQYWENYLKDKDTKFGFIESYSSILTCSKESSMLSLYSKDSNKTYKFQQKYDAYTGEVKGDKVREGDLKTPIGIYNLTKRIDKLDSFYGPLALVTSYPNLYDKYRGKNGSGIWIHGLPINQKRDEYTKGCIAINNTNIECLDKKIKIDDTLLIINDTNISADVSKDSLATILSQVYAWRYSWIYNDIDTYLSFYSNDFVRDDGMDYDRFITYKTRVFNKQEKKTIIFKDINIIPYPNTQNLYQITFKEYYRSESFKFTGNKILMVKLETDKIKIITEK